jgi:hypothetical protein
MLKRISILLFVTFIASLSACSDVAGNTAYGDGSSDSDADADSDSDSDTDSDVDSDADSDTDSDADSDAGANADADSDADGDASADTDAGADTDSDGDIDVDGGTFTCNGTVVGDACWYLSEENTSCDDICDLHGGFDVATQDYAGSDGTDAHCTEVLEALGASGGTVLPLYDSGAGVGCMTYFDLRYRISDTATTADATYSGAQRACACVK